MSKKSQLIIIYIKFYSTYVKIIYFYYILYKINKNDCFD